MKKTTYINNTAVRVLVGLGAMVLADSAMAGNYLGSIGNTITSGDNNTVNGYTNSIAGSGNDVSGYTNAVSGSNNVVFGRSNTVSGQSGVVLGTQTSSSGNNTVVIGSGVKSTKDRTVAIGYNANASNISSVAVGSNSTVTASHSVALGSNAYAGKTNGKASVGYIAIGLNSKSEAGIAIGNSAVTGGDGAGGVIAIGQKATASGYASVAIGENVTSGDGTNNKQRNWALGSDTTVTGYQSWGMGRNVIVKGTSSIAFGTNASAVGNYDYAIGEKASVVGQNSLAFGTNAIAEGNYTAVVGADSHAKGNNTTIMGSRSVVQVSGGTALGYNTITQAENATAVGTNAAANQKYSTAVGTGTVTTAESSAAFGHGAVASHKSGVALGAKSETKQQVAVNDAEVNGIKYSGFAGSDSAYSDGEHGGVSVGNAGYERQIHYVAPGEISATSTDAINGSQLYAVASEVGKNRQAIEALTVEINAHSEKLVEHEAKKHTSVTSQDNSIIVSTSTNAQGGTNYDLAVDVGAINNHVTNNIMNKVEPRITKVENQVQDNRKRIDALDSRISRTDRKLRAGVAAATAVANIPQVYTSGKSAVGVGIGGYRGEHAVAVGYSRASDNGKHITKLPIGVDSRAHANYGGGYAYQW